MTEDNDILEYFVCDCHSPQHSFTFNDMQDVDGNWEDSVWISIHMAQYMPWYKRIWYAIKYIFGYKSRYGDWDTVLLKPKDMIRLRNLLDEAIKRRKTNHSWQPLFAKEDIEKNEK